MSHDLRCVTCAHRDAEGFCTNDKLWDYQGQSVEEARDMLLYEFSEGGRFKVGEAFGCIHHSARVTTYLPRDLAPKNLEELKKGNV